jgi:hypothetical protein
MQCNFLFLVPYLQKLILRININLYQLSPSKDIPKNIHIIHIYNIKIRMQHIFIHSNIQILKHLSIFTLNLCALNILCGNLQSFNQIRIDEIMIATKVNRNNDLLLLNTSMNL